MLVTIQLQFSMPLSKDTHTHVIQLTVNYTVATYWKQLAKHTNVVKRLTYPLTLIKILNNSHMLGV